MKPKEYLTDEQKDFIKANAGKKYISEMARKLQIPRGRISTFLRENNINFKRAEHTRGSNEFYPEGCFNPHERKNWLV